MPEIIAVFQDCVLCGVKGKQIIAEYAKKGITLRKVSFISEEGRELCAKAVSLGIGGMPFYTDGKVFATTIDGVLNSETKPAKKNKQPRKEKKNGTVSKTKR